jgi:hypothetical protein
MKARRYLHTQAGLCLGPTTGSEEPPAQPQLEAQGGLPVQELEQVAGNRAKESTRFPRIHFASKLQIIEASRSVPHRTTNLFSSFKAHSLTSKSAPAVTAPWLYRVGIRNRAFHLLSVLQTIGNADNSKIKYQLRRDAVKCKMGRS